MNKDNLILISAILILLVGMLCNTKVETAYINKITQDSIIKQTISTQKYHEILTIAKNISDKPYIIDVYDCSDKSSDLVIALRNKGYEAQVIYGFAIFSSNYERHAWVRMWIGNKNFDIEATTGWFIYPDEYFKEYLE